MTLAPYLDAAHEEENAALLSTLMFLRAEALELTGRASEARIVRLDSLNWARAIWIRKASENQTAGNSGIEPA